MIPTAIQQALQPLVGLPLRRVQRTANLLSLNLGESREVVTRGRTRVTFDWAIHIQCSWRICRQRQILVAYRDYYSGPEGEALDDWDSSGASRFDRRTDALNADLEPLRPRVLTVAVDYVGGFSLALDHDYRLDVFPDDSGHDECSEHWRIFQPGTECAHFAVRNVLPEATVGHTKGLRLVAPRGAPTKRC